MRLRTRFKRATGIAPGGGFSLTPHSLSVTPASASIDEAETQQLAAVVSNAAAAALYGPQALVDFTTSDAAIATVNASGLVTGVAAGNCVITGTVRGTSITDTVDIEVTEPA
jgi:uncharacterized protein YjdB